MDAKQVLSKIKFTVFRDFPFYTDLVLNLEHIFTEVIPLMATDGEHIYINPKFLQTSEFKNCLFSYLHELKHLALFHHLTMKKYSNRDAFLMNISQDVIVNPLTYEEVQIGWNFREGLIFPEKFKELRDKDVRKYTHLEIYDMLYKRLNKTLSNLNIPEPTTNPKDILKDFAKKWKQFSDEVDKKVQDEGMKFIFKNIYPDYYFQRFFQKLDKKKKEELAKKIRDAVLKGYTLAKQRGNIPSGAEYIYQHLFKKVRNWKKELREEIIEVFKGDWTWRKVSDILQSLHVAGFRQVGNLPSQDYETSAPEVIVGIDSSGSIGHHEYKSFLNEVYSILKTVRLPRYTIVIWECEVTKVFEGRVSSIKKALDFLRGRKGFGGTRLRSFLEYCNKVGCYNKVAIIFTDGEVETDLKVEEFNKFRKVIFVLTKDGDYENIAKLKSPKIKILKIRNGV